MEKRTRGIISGLLAGAIGMALAASGCRLPEIEVGSVDFRAIPDGSYEGSYKAEMGSATVKVGIAGGRVTGIELVAFDSSPIGEPAKAMTGRVVERQGLDADCVSGATYSSKVILKAIENALPATGK
jgi:uncharacterized protein with FMN-binding domain